MSCRVAGISAALVVASLPASLGAQAPIQLPVPISRVAMADAVRLTIDRNQALRALRFTIDAAKADEITAALKPNFNVTFGAEGFPLFSPDQITPGFLGNEISYSAGLGYAGGWEYISPQVEEMCTGASPVSITRTSSLSRRS